MEEANADISRQLLENRATWNADRWVRMNADQWLDSSVLTLEYLKNATFGIH